jgi:hypothetical protein
MSPVVGAAKNFYGVWKKVRHRLERLERASGAAGKIYDDGLVANDGNSAGEHSGGRFLHTFAANLFREAGNRAIRNI